MSKKNLLLLVLVSLNCCATQLFLKMPNLNEDQLAERRIESRAVRIDGIRLEAERIENKLFIHNYGYGHDGLCLALGGAQEAVQLMEFVSRGSLPKRNPIAVIGSGIVGLSVAHALLEKGYKVVIYAQDFPPHTTSSTMYGMYSPQALPSRSPLNKNMFDRIKESSWKKLQKLAQEFKGVRLLDCFDFNEASISYGQTVDVVLNMQLKKQAIRHKTFVVDGTLFVPKLFDEVRVQGAQCIECSFANLREMLSLPEIVVFNCTGFGARNLCNDAQLRIVQQPLLYFKNSSGIDYASIHCCKDSAVSCVMLPANNYIVMRGLVAAGNDIIGGNEYIYKKMLELVRFETKNNSLNQQVWTHDTAQKQTTNIYDESLSFALKKLNCKGGEKILLWGCNNQATCVQLAAKVPQGSVVGADVTPRLIGECQNKFSKIPNISFHITNKKVQEFQIYDYVVMLMSMHMPLDQQVADSLYLALKQKGGFLLMIPANNQHPLFTSVRTCLKELYVPRNFDEAKAVFNTLESHEIKNMLSSSGFKSVIVSESICPLHFTSRNIFYDWIYQYMSDIECLNEFDNETKKIFFANVVDQYLMRYILTAQDNVRYDMPFALVYAQK